MSVLQVVMYHYVRDFAHDRFPKLKGMELANFRKQILSLEDQFEFATLESALALVEGKYQPLRPMVLLTFDDGLREHAETVTPLLAEHGVQGLFFVSSVPLAESRVLPVHQSHLLMADLGFSEYRARIVATYKEMTSQPLPEPDAEFVKKTYRWDDAETGKLKAVLNFVLSEQEKNELLQVLFREHFGDETAIAHQLYAQPEELRAMQQQGMVIGGHSHRHQALSTLTPVAHQEDLATNRALLGEWLFQQERWPFCVPYGKLGHYHTETKSVLESLGYSCAFSTEVGNNELGADPWALRRVDCKDIS